MTSLLVNTHDVAGKTVASITFGLGTGVIDRTTANSLADGNYRLEIDATQITSASSMLAMENNYAYGAQPTDNFFRLYGDGNGDGNTDFIDFSGGFLPAFGTGVGSNGYLDEFDSNGDGNVDFIDFSNGFLPNFGTGR